MFLFVCRAVCLSEFLLSVGIRCLMVDWCVWNDSQSAVAVCFVCVCLYVSVYVRLFSSSRWRWIGGGDSVYLGSGRGCRCEDSICVCLVYLVFPFNQTVCFGVTATDQFEMFDESQFGQVLIPSDRFIRV